MALVSDAYVADGSGSGMVETVATFTRVLAGDGSNETIQSGSDGLHELIDGKGGDDTIVYAHNFADYHLMPFAAKIYVTGTNTNDTLMNIEHLQFADKTVDADAIFNPPPGGPTQSPVPMPGPTVSLDAAGYRAVYADAAASSLGAQDHYHQIGWHEGHDPSAGFDTTLYLIHNPDVAAAGVDPFEHYLTHGAAEGRQAYQAVGQTIVGGFDAEYYLWHNPDVAAAGVDPLAHYNAYGWHEGRNPNANFDTAGYLSHYGDVAAAGVNPLQHYEMYGWHEGRDPSAGFDTLGYLAANPDVAAAHVNPLDHYLQFGIYEGRSMVSDGLWH
jgi:hypothetical protein